jgi:hypothetical protein
LYHRDTESAEKKWKRRVMSDMELPLPAASPFTRVTVLRGIAVRINV